MSDEVRVTAAFDREIISEGGDSIRYLRVELTTPPRTADGAHISSPLNLAVVIDSSRSMVGARLNSAIRAAADIVEALTEDDYISIVSFSDTAIVHVNGISGDDWGKQYALDALRTITLRAGTNLSEGWFKGAECVGTVMVKNPRCKNHVLLLSDGHANQGTLEPAALVHHATELQTRGVTASAVGVGEGYSTAQLYAIAQHGGGRIHHATHPPEIVEVVLGELDELRERRIENLMVNVDFPTTILLKSLNIIPCEMTQVSARCVFGGMSAGSTRCAIFRVGTSAGRKNQKVDMHVTAQWRKSGQAEQSAATPCTASMTYASPERNAEQTVDVNNALSIGKYWQSWIVWQATNLNRLKDFSRLERMLARELKYFRRFARSAPAAFNLLAELEQLNKIAHQDWDETSRKEIQSATYTHFYNLKDSRSDARSWQEHTGQFKKHKLI